MLTVGSVILMAEIQGEEMSSVAAHLKKDIRDLAISKFQRDHQKRVVIKKYVVILDSVAIHIFRIFGTGQIHM